MQSDEDDVDIDPHPQADEEDLDEEVYNRDPEDLEPREMEEIADSWEVYYFCAYTTVMVWCYESMVWGYMCYYLLEWLRSFWQMLITILRMFIRYDSRCI